MLTRPLETAAVRVNKGVRLVLHERFIERVQVVVCAPVPYAIGELCREQIASAGSEDEQSSYVSHWLYRARIAATFSLRDPLDESAMPCTTARYMRSSGHW